ncbi:hypothetical protein AgCh_000901 [Apium graveolens]
MRPIAMAPRMPIYPPGATRVFGLLEVGQAPPPMIATQVFGLLEVGQAPPPMIATQVFGLLEVGQAPPPMIVTQIAKRKDKLLNYMLFLRITPTLPNLFINLASPIMDIPFHVSFTATVIGLIPASYITVRNKDNCLGNGWGYKWQPGVSMDIVMLVAAGKYTICIGIDLYFINIKGVYKTSHICDLEHCQKWCSGSIKIPTFDETNYTLWKKKMMLFIRMANPLYIQILKNGPFTPMVRVEEFTDGDMVIPAHYAPKDPAEYSEPEKEKEEDEFYTLDELDELDQSMAYMARKFSNIRVKKPSYFKGKGQSFNKDNSWKGKGKKPKKAKKDKAYLELEAKYEAFLKKQQSKAYIAEGKSWDVSENDEDEEFGNYTLMALEQGESASSKSHVPTLTTIDLNVNQYKETIEKMSTKMFHIHTSMIAANEENKLKCANEIEAVLREKLEKNEVKLKSFRNASELVGKYHEKNKPCANIVIGLDYDAMNDKKKTMGDKGKAKKTENAPTFLKEVNIPIFKAYEVNFNEEELIIKKEITDEDKEKKIEESTQSSNTKEKLMDKQSSKTPVKETKTEDTRKKKKNRNGKIWINKKKQFCLCCRCSKKEM